jgi:tetratricopeptide (TPR) repeat protein
MDILNQNSSDYHQMVQTSLAANNIDKAASICTDGLTKYPSDAQLWSDLSQISIRTGQNKMAINAILKAIDCEPNNVWHVFQLAGCYLQLQVFRPAIRALDSARDLLNVHSNAQQWNKYGELRYMANQLDLAVLAHSNALKIEPDSLSSRNQLAALLRFKGDISGAEKLHREVIELEPNNYQACYSLSQLRRFKTSDAPIKLLERCQQQLEPGDNGHIMLHYAIGKIYEDIGNYHQAFDHYSQGAAIKRQQRPYNISQDVELMKTVVEFSDAQPALHPSPTETHEQTPIFIVGLPRTGTTLVERILASHSKVVSGGELNAFPMALLEAGGKPIAAGLEGLDQNLVKSLTPKTLKDLASRYLQLANNYVNEAPIFVDKLPYNFLYCGLILHAFPHAKIVHVNRNPFDAALSNFKMLFDRGYEYSYCLKDTADFISAYNQLMLQWKSRFPEQIYSIEYEHLVSSQEQQTRKLLAFCQLDWDPECLNFHQNNSVSQTASASQVREPIYSRSVDLWRKFETQLTPLLDIFAKHGIKPNDNKD